jgi:hypothetical protein
MNAKNGPKHLSRNPMIQNHPFQFTFTPTKPKIYVNVVQDYESPILIFLNKSDKFVIFNKGGYGQVYLARKKESMEICALKKMSKNLLVKLGEVLKI